MPRTRLFLVAVLAFAGCKDGGRVFSDAPPPEDAMPVDALGVIDAAPPAPGRELTAGGGRVQGASYILDVQIGHGVSQRPSRGSAVIVEGNAPVKP